MEITEAMRASFPLIQGGDFDLYFGHMPWQIGLKSTYPNSLKRKLAAVAASEFLGIRSIDYVLKNYLADVNYPEEDGSRLDRRIRSFVSGRMSELDAAIRYVACDPDKPVCMFVSEWTLSRAPFSMELLTYCGQRGALFEALAIARMMLEQLAWSYVVNANLDEKAIHNVSASRAVTSFKANFSFSGRLYGWLSSHIHWTVDGHKKSMVSRGKETGHLYGSPYFKAMIFTVMILLSKGYLDVIWSLYQDKLEHAQPGQVKPYDKILMASECTAFFSEIAECSGHDVELGLLASMLTE